MNCAEALKFLSPYIDSKLDPKTSFEIARHLEHCASCTARFAQERGLETKITETVRAGSADPELWERVTAAATGQTGPRSRRGRITGGAAAAAAVLVLGAFVLMRRQQTADPPDLVLALVADHEKLAGGAEKVQLATADVAAIGTFFKDRLPVGVRCPAGGFVPAGARNCYLRERLVGYVQGTVSGRTVSLFFIPATALERFPGMAAALGDGCAPYVASVGRCGVLVRARGDEVVCAVGELPVDRLMDLIE